MRTGLRLSVRAVQLMQIVVNICITTEVAAAVKTSTASGSFNSSSTWSPAGIPQAGDDVFILAGHSITFDNNHVQNVVIAGGGELKGASGKTLAVDGNFTVNGSADMNGGNIILTTPGSKFKIGSTGEFIWNPGDNTSGGATLLTNGEEQFDPGSTLNIRKWFDYTKSLGEFVTDNFGNLKINTPGGSNSIVEWNQKNNFESHKITGTLTIEDGWITLDKSGSISSTTIGNIILSSINSVFIAHAGNHPSSFSLTTSSIENNGGRFYGLSDGNGNIKLNVSGNFSTSGNTKIINNSGISNVSNGNAELIVGGNLIQTAGDMRIIYNIASLNSGKYTFTAKNLILNGGIFMGQSACHTDGATNYFNITNDFTVNFQNMNDRFRGNGITTIGSTVNNAGLAMHISGNVSIAGVQNAEFTSSASSGNETVRIDGNLHVSGCTNNLNYGTPAAEHASELFVKGNTLITGGITTLSKNAGGHNSIFENDLKISSGTLRIKGSTGNATMKVKGRYIQSGGTLTFHAGSNSTQDIISFISSGVFDTQAGTIDFDESQGGISHQLHIRGPSYSTSTSSTITRSGNSTTSSFGKIIFDRAGKIDYISGSASGTFEKAGIEIEKNCNLSVGNCNLFLPNADDDNFQNLKINKGGKITLNNSSIRSSSNNDCNIQSEDNAIISLAGSQELQMALPASVHLQQSEKSIIEYSGHNQKIYPVTGGYKILRLNQQNEKSEMRLMNDITVNTRIEFIKGSLRLTNRSLIIENGNPNSVIRKNGFIMSDIDPSGISGRIIWKNWDNGNYEIPFGRNGKYLPVRFSNVVAHASEIIIGSQQTNKNNLPCPFTNGLLSEENFSVSKVIDRWWTIQAPGVTADVSFTYSGDENISTSPVGTVSIMQWNGTSWEKLSNSPAGNNVANAQEVSNFSRFIIVKDDEGPFSQETPEQERASVTSPDKSAELKIISVSPNPFTTTLNVDYTTKTKSTFILTDASGRTVRQFEATLAETSKTANLTGLEDLKKGIYFLSIAGDGKKDTVKLIKND